MEDSEGANEPFALIESSDLILNIKTKGILITEDKLKNCLRDYLEIVEKKNKWQLPLSVFFSLLAAFLTASFDKPILGTPPDTVKGVFLTITAGFGLWTLVAAIRAYRCRTSGSLDGLIEKIKGEKPDISEERVDFRE